MLYLPTGTYKVLYRVDQNHNNFGYRSFLYFDGLDKVFQIEISGLSFISQSTASQTELQNSNNRIIIKRVLYEIGRHENIHDIEKYEEQLICEINRALHEYKYKEPKYYVQDGTLKKHELEKPKPEKPILFEVLVYLKSLKLDPELLSSYALGSYAIESTREINKLKREHIEKYGTWIDKFKNYF